MTDNNHYRLDAQVLDSTGIMLNSALAEPVTIEFYLGVTRCPDRAALGVSSLNQRGHDDWPEITCWPKREHYRLTTGAEFNRLGSPDPVRLNETEKQICAILGLNELELGVFLREWTTVPTDKIHTRPNTLDAIQRELRRAQ